MLIPLGIPHHHIKTIGGYYLPEITSVYILAFIRRNSRFTTENTIF